MFVYFHIGFHKTATTLIQKVYRDLSSELNEALIQPESSSYQDFRGQLLRLRNGGDNFSDAVEAWSDMKLRFPDEQHIRVSDENVIGRTPFGPGDKDGGYCYPTLERQIQALTNIFGNQVKFIVSCRNSVDFIYSMYCDGLRYGRYGYTFHEYLDHLEIGSFSNVALLRRVVNSTTAPVTAVNYDAFSDNPVEFIRSFIPGITDGVANDYARKRINQSGKKSFLTVSRLFAGHSYEDRQKLRKWLSQVPVNLRDNQTFLDVEIDDAAVDRIQDKNVADTKDFFKSLTAINVQ